MTETYDVTAIVPLGGSGTRIYPLTLLTQKHMLPIVNRALLHSSAEHWADQGVKTFIFGVTGYENRAQTFDFFGHGGRIRTPKFPAGAETYYTTYEDREYRNDKKGSADVFLWALKRYQPIIDGNQILLINGDNLSNTSLKDFYEFHREKDALLTIAVKGFDIEDPVLMEFGTVVFDDKTMKVSEFVEKSQSPPSRYANTGICLFSPRIYDLMRSDKMRIVIRERSDGGKMDVGGHLIPSLVDLKEDVYAFPLSGKWSDVGTPHSYRVTSDDIREGRYPHIRLTGYEKVHDSLVHKTTKKLMGSKLGKINLEGMCVIGSNADIGEGTTISGSVLGPNTTVGKNAHIVGGTTLLSHASVGDCADLSNAIVGKNTTLESTPEAKFVVHNGAIIGDDLFLPAGFEVGADWRMAGANHRAKIEAKNAKYKVVEEFKKYDAIRFVSAK